MKIVYITNCFGTQSHTFIRREIDALRKNGAVIALYGIRQDHSAPTDVQSYVKETDYLYPFSPGTLIRANLGSLTRQPINYIKGALRAFFSPEFSVRRRAKMLYHYVVGAIVAEKLLNSGVDHIHAHFMNVSASIAMYASQHCNIPYSITVHSAGTFKTPHVLGVHQKLRSAQALLMISHNNLNYFDSISSCRLKSHVVRCGMNLEKFTYRHANEYKTHVPLRLMGVGRFVEKKGFEHLIHAATILNKRAVNFSLTLIGDGPLKTRLKALVEENGLEDRVVFTGQQSTNYVREAMQTTDIVIVPSVTSRSGEQEGLPVVIMEAMATGVPVVASRHSGIPEIVQDQLTGYLTEEKNADAIAQAIQKISESDVRPLIENAHTLIHNTFNIESVAIQRHAIFSDLISDTTKSQ